MRSTFPNGGRAVKACLSAGVLIIVLVAIGAVLRFGLLQGNTEAPTPPPLATPSPGVVSPGPLRVQATPTPPAALGPAPVTDTTYLHEPFALEQCGTCHDLLNVEDPEALWGPVVEVCRVCHWQTLDAPQPTFIHDPYPEGECLDCHEPHASGQPFLLLKPQPQVCLDCHEDFPPDGQPHPDLAAGECLLCHAGHGSATQAILRKPQSDLCTRCHADHVVEGPVFVAHTEEQARECATCHDPHTGEPQDAIGTAGCRQCHEDIFVATPAVSHEPVEEQDCLACHDFHRREHVDLLRQDQPETCTRCHEEEQPLEQPHPQLAAGECLLCHTGHGGQQAALLRREERSLCGTCHEEQVTPMALRVTEHFRDENLPACDTCHDPHQGSVKAGWELAEACGGCHTDALPSRMALAANSPIVHEPLREEGCIACHDFHTVEQDRPLEVAVNTLCLDCHEDVQHDAHPVSGAQDRWNGGPLTCVSCHAPHDSPYPAELRLPGDALCLKCHGFGVLSRR